MVQQALSKKTPASKRNCRRLAICPFPAQKSNGFSQRTVLFSKVSAKAEDSVGNSKKDVEFSGHFF